jgi:hypothetical protein
MNARPRSPVPRRRRLLGSGVVVASTVKDVVPVVVLVRLKSAGVLSYPISVRRPVPERFKNGVPFNEPLKSTTMLSIVNVERPDPTLNNSTPLAALAGAKVKLFNCAESPRRLANVPVA